MGWVGRRAPGPAPLQRGLDEGARARARIKSGGHTALHMCFAINYPLSKAVASKHDLGRRVVSNGVTLVRLFDSDCTDFEVYFQVLFAKVL